MFKREIFFYETDYDNNFQRRAYYRDLKEIFYFDHTKESGYFSYIFIILYDLS